MLNVTSVAFLAAFCCAILFAPPARASEAFGPSNISSNHGRVLIVQNRRATEAFSPKRPVIREMLQAGLERFTAKSNLTQAWRALVSTQDVIGIKVYSSPGPSSGTRPAVVSDLIESLLAAGYSPDKIVVWDRRAIDLRLAGYFKLAEKYHVSVTGAMDEGYDPEVSYASPLLGRLVYGDLEFGQKGEGVGRRSYVSKLLTRKITKIISVTPLLNHNLAGVSGALYGLATGSVDNILRFEDPERLATAVPEIFALPEIGDRVVLNIVDALICQYRGEEGTLLHYSVAANQLWFTSDAVAADVLGMEELDRYKSEDPNRKTGSQIYLNAGLMDLGAADPKQITIERLQLN